MVYIRDSTAFYLLSVHCNWRSRLLVPCSLRGSYWIRSSWSDQCKEAWFNLKKHLTKINLSNNRLTSKPAIPANITVNLRGNPIFWLSDSCGDFVVDDGRSSYSIVEERRWSRFESQKYLTELFEQFRCHPDIVTFSISDGDKDRYSWILVYHLRIPLMEI